MTLIITVANLKHMVQTSDMRISSSSSTKDEVNKAIVVNCRDAHFSIAYTGIATFPVEPTGRWASTAKWLSEYLYSLHVCMRSIDEIHELFENDIVPRFRRLSPISHTTFVLCGIKRTLKSGRVWFSPFAKYHPRLPEKQFLKQSLSVTEKQSDAWSYESRLSCHGIRNPAARSNRFLRSAGWEDVSAKFVATIRRASEDVAYGKVIGRDCTTVAIPTDGGPISSRRYCDKSPDITTSPIYLTNNLPPRMLMLEGKDAGSSACHLTIPGFEKLSGKKGH